MSLRFYFGPTDGALSKRVYQDVIDRSLEHPTQNFLVIVPDQFTMQTQKELSAMHPRGGILNIDVLSFGRLGHRVLEEVDCREIPVLDDTGKCLVLQKVAEGMEEELPVLGSLLRKQGYIREVKSAISEFMQYGLSPKDVEELVAYSGDRKALAGKLKDLGVIYERFSDYIRDHYVTAEETLDLLCKNLPKSKLLKGSIVVLDGYTGFTPIQYRVLREIALLCDEMILTFVCGTEDSPYRLEGEQKLFYLTQKTVHDLERLAYEAGIQRDRRDDIFLTDEQPGGELAFLREHFFRYDGCRYPVAAVPTVPDGVSASGATPAPAGTAPASSAASTVQTGTQTSGSPASSNGAGPALKISEMMNPAQEVHRTASEICRLVQSGSIAYRDIVIVSGDLEGYAPYIESEFERIGIPCFIDRTRSITLNPLTEFMLSALNLSLKNFSYEAVFHYLRSGLTGISTEEIDRLENYVLETGIRGKTAYSRRFSRKTKAMRKKPEDESALITLDHTREVFASQVMVLTEKKKDKASAFVDRLYDFLVAAGAEQALKALSDRFTQQGDASRAKEYAQIYRLVMDLLNQIYGLLGEEQVTLQEFVDILTAGLAEIQVGIIPQSVDRVLVGDMERTRFKPVKVLFFLGVNDGNIPRSTAKGGIISDVEREFLKDSSHALAPTPRQQMFIQRFYLYLNITKPSKYLYFSYSRQGSDGKTLRPAYLIDTLKRMFPGLTVSVPAERPALTDLMTREEGKLLLAQDLRDFAMGTLQKEREKELYALYSAFDGEETSIDRDHYFRAAFIRHEDKPLLREISRLVYGEILENSVSRLETFAACAYRHFLKYGLSLKEREEYGFEAVDLGNVYHDVLEAFSRRLEKEQQTWFTFDEAFALRVLPEIMEKTAVDYENSVLFANERSRYQIRRMERILLRTILTLQSQLRKGTFAPLDYEIGFTQTRNLRDVGLSEKEKMRIIGRIDRVDTAQQGNNLYVKVLDYKSGNKNLDLVALYYGLQLQLVVYMNAALEKEQKAHPDMNVIPAALLYYHVDDPMIEEKKELSEDELAQQLKTALRARGLVNDDPQIVQLLDGEFTEKSDAIPVERKKDGTFGARSSIMSSENLGKLSAFVSKKLSRIGKEILEGNIALSPYTKENGENACTYCPYGKVCGFDPAIPGCEAHILRDLSDEEVLRRIDCEE